MREHVRLRRALATGVVGAVAGVGLLVAQPAWADDAPEVNVSNARVRVGDQVQVAGRGFEPGDRVNVQVCGAPDASGRLACGKGQQDVAVAADGTVTSIFGIHEPSGPCPCTVVIDRPDGPPVSTRIELLGYAVAKSPKAPEIVVDSAVIGSSPGFSHYFGMAPEPSVTLMLRNAGASAAQPTVELAWRDGDGEPVAITDSGVPVIEPGQSVEFSMPMTFGAFAQGEHTVSGQVVVGDLFAPVEASTTVAPWGLYGLAAFALVGGALLRARRVVPARVPASPDADVVDVTPTVAVPTQRTSPPPAARPQETTLVGPPRLEATPLAPHPVVTSPQQDRATVSEALQVIEERKAEAPARLPDRYEVPPQSGRRAERGGKRAARPEKGRWITRR